MRSIFLAAVAVLNFSGCAIDPATGERELTEGGKTALREVAAIAVSRHVRESPVAAARVDQIRETLRELQSLPDITSVDGLRAIVQARIDTKISDPWDRHDLTRLLNIVEPLLIEYVGVGRLDAGAVVKVKDFLAHLEHALPAGIMSTVPVPMTTADPH